MSPDTYPDKQSVIKKAVMAKYLFLHATALSEGEDSLSTAMSVNGLHDAVEIILLAIEDALGIDNKMAQFKTHLKEIRKANGDQPVPQARHLLTLDQTRGNFKHNAVIPEKDSVKDLIGHVDSFFRQACQLYLNISFDEVSLCTLVDDENVREHLNKAERALNDQQLEEVFNWSGVAFEFAMENALASLNKTRFFRHSSDWNWSKDQLTKTVGLESAGLIRESFRESYEMLTLLLFGVDLHKFARFQLLTPSISIAQSGTFQISHVGQYDNDYNKTENNARFCLEFAIDFALKVQKDWLGGLKATYELD